MHVQFELECIDRLYLNLYVPILQQEAGPGSGAIIGVRSSARLKLMAPMSHAFILALGPTPLRDSPPTLEA